MLLKEFAEKYGWGFRVKLAKFLDVTPGMTSRWIKGDKIPIERCLQIFVFTEGEVSLEELRPDIDWSFYKTVVNKEPMIKVSESQIYQLN